MWRIVKAAAGTVLALAALTVALALAYLCTLLIDAIGGTVGAMAWL